MNAKLETVFQGSVGGIETRVDGYGSLGLRDDLISPEVAGLEHLEGFDVPDARPGTVGQHHDFGRLRVILHSADDACGPFVFPTGFDGGLKLILLVRPQLARRLRPVQDLDGTSPQDTLAKIP